MKYSNFITRIVCLALLLAALGQYQVRAALKAQKESENAAAIAEVEAYNREIRRQMESAENAGNSSPYADGKYEGTAEGFGGPVHVEVTIDGGDLTDIQVLEAKGEDPAYYSQAEEVLKEILATQGVQVDTVSGATFSSNGLIHAVTEALRKAVRSD